MEARLLADFKERPLVSVLLRSIARQAVSKRRSSYELIRKLFFQLRRIMKCQRSKERKRQKNSRAAMDEAADLDQL
jgi:hypothetical protein